MCPIPHTSAYRPEGKLLETDGDRRIMLRMGPVHARDNSQGVSDTELECTAGYRDLLYARTGIGCHRSHRNRPRDLWHNRQAGEWGANQPTEIPSSLQVESKYVATRHYKTIINIETISVFNSFSHPGVSCSIIMYVV